MICHIEIKVEQICLSRLCCPMLVEFKLSRIQPQNMCEIEFPIDQSIRFWVPNKNWTPAWELRTYEQYGNVRSCRCFFKKDGLECIITFDDKAVVDRIASTGYICINDERIKIELLATYYSKITPLNIDDDGCVMLPQAHTCDGTSVNANTLNISELNDDCLHLIFKKFHIPTLLSVSKVCVNFNKIAKDVFRLKYRTTQIRFCDVVRNYPIPMHRIDEFFKTFGSSIESLYLAPDEFNFNEYHLNDVLKQINKNCMNLKVLDMQTVVVNDKISNEVLPLFSRLESLKIKFGYSQSIDIIQSFDGLISVCNQLKHLDVIRNDNVNVSYSIVQSYYVLPKLTSLAIQTSNSKCLELFLLNQLQLDAISIRFIAKKHPEHLLQIPDLLRIICQCVNVERLSIAIVSDDNVSTNLVELGELLRVRHFKLNFIGCPYRQNVNINSNVFLLMNKMLQNNIELECLDLDHGIVNANTIDVIAQFKSISKLNLMIDDDDRLTENRLIDLVKQLPKLADLCVQLKPNDFNTIVNFVKPIISSGENLSNLTIALYNGYSIKVRSQYEDLVEIVKKRKIKKKLTLTIKNEQYVRGEENCEKELYVFIEINREPEFLKLKAEYVCINLI